MNLYEKISVLGPGAKYDTCGPKDLGNTTDIPGVYYAKTSNGAECRLFKVLQTNACRNNCKYCAFRRDRSCQRVLTTSDEMAKAFMLTWDKRLVDGLFLSSGITDTADSTMTRLLDTVMILRKNYRYSGYIHLKIMPGSSRNVIENALSMANRVSINIESPTESDLEYLSPDKTFRDGFVPTLEIINEEIKRRKYFGKKTPSITTQFIVGAGMETDRHLMMATDRLYKRFGLKRVFYSAFRPVEDTPLSEKEAASPVRQHRLYQSDFLLRTYHFSVADFVFDDSGFISEQVDPKTLWAKNHPEIFPVNINTADFYTLLKVPTIGPTTAEKIVQMRKGRKIRSCEEIGGRIKEARVGTYICY